jgi:CTP synthase (UTP-ammonia lyase)
MVRVAIVGDYRPSVTAHRAIPEALRRASDGDEQFAGIWVETADLAADPSEQLASFHGLWCVPASPYANPEGVFNALRFVRETGRPFLGTCGGFQHALLEYARTFWGIASPAHAEMDPEATDPVIAPLACSLVEKSGELRFVPGSRVAALYGVTEAVEEYHCSYGLSARYRERLRSGVLRVSALDPDGEVRAVELDGHPFYIATLFQPERSALAGRDHPLIRAFVEAVRERARVTAPARSTP